MTPCSPIATVALLASVLLSGGSNAIAGEPATEFLQRLRSAGYYDHAISFLGRLDKIPGLDTDFTSAAKLELARTHIDAAINARTARRRDEEFDLAVENLTEFLKQKSHPRAAEARSQLGKLQMVRGAQLVSGDVDASKRRQARDLFLAAGTTFDTIVTELRDKLKELQGARIDPNKQPEQAAQRDQYRFEFLQAQQNAAEARLEAAQTFDDPAKEGKEILTAALQLTTDLSEKYEAYIQGASAFYFRGRIEQMLGEPAKALESFTRMLEQPDADDLREAKLGATVGMIELAMAKKPADWVAATAAGQLILDGLRPNERNLPKTQQLRLAMVEALLAKSKDEKKTKPAERTRATAEARKLLIEAKKTPGRHSKTTEKLLADLGITSDSESEVALPVTTEDPKSFVDSLSIAQQVLQNSQQVQEQLDLLEKQGAMPTEIEPLETSLAEMRQNGIAVLRRGLAMINRQTDVRQINEARKYLAFLLYNDDRPRETVVVGEYLARTAPATEDGLRGGLLALASLQKLIAEGQTEAAPSTERIESLGQYLMKIWPKDPQATAAQGILIRLALTREEFDKAAAEIDKLPDGVEKSSFKRLQGQLKYQQASRLRTEGDTAAASQMLDSATADLKTGLEGITGGLVAPGDLQAALFLAKAQLQRGDPAAAVATLDHPKYGPVKLIGKVDSPSEAFLPELYRTQLQSLVGQMTTGKGDNQALIKRATEAMDRLRESAQGPEGEKRLVGIFLSLATEIRQQLDESTPDQKEKLISAFSVFLARIAETSSDPATLQWVGQTLLEMGESAMPPGATKADGQAAALLADAAKTFEGIKGGADVPLTNQYLLGKSLRLLGRYSESLTALETLLKEKPMMLDAQKEAALAYEQWAATLDPKLKPKAYQAAMSGGRPGADNKNVLWGWGRIAQLTQRGDQFRDNFFEARLHIAICRYLIGKAESSPTDQKKLMDQAIRDITSVAALYPDLGGPERRQEFDALLRKIQADAGQPVTGLP